MPAGAGGGVGHDFHASVLIDHYHESPNAAYQKEAFRESNGRAITTGVTRRKESVKYPFRVVLSLFDQPRLDVDQGQRPVRALVLQPFDALGQFVGA